jgi:hypothetical protein
MGRGRAKAKQTKVARKLKYYTPDTDLTALERELRGESTDQPDNGDVVGDSHDDEDDYGAWTSDQR